MSEVNGTQTGKTIKELVLEHDEKLDSIRSEIDKVKGAVYLAIFLGAVNVLDILAPLVARGGQ